MLNLMKSNHFHVLSKLTEKPVVRKIDDKSVIFLNDSQWPVQDILQVLYDVETSIHSVELQDQSMIKLFEHMHPHLPLELGWDNGSELYSLHHYGLKSPHGSPSECFIHLMENDFDFQSLSE